MGADPDFLVTKSNKEVANFSLATNHYWKDENNEKKEKVTWHNVTVWGKQALFVRDYVKSARLREKRYER